MLCLPAGSTASPVQQPLLSASLPNGNKTDLNQNPGRTLRNNTPLGPQFEAKGNPRSKTVSAVKIQAPAKPAGTARGRIWGGCCIQPGASRLPPREVPGRAGVKPDSEQLHGAFCLSQAKALHFPAPLQIIQDFCFNFSSSFSSAPA